MAKAGRIAKNTTVAAEPNVDVQKIGSAMDAMRDQAQEGQMELLELAGDVGALQMAGLTVKFLRAAEIRLFERVRESRKIKDLPIKTPDGLRRAETLTDFCPLVFGRSYSVMAEESQNLDLLGDQAYEDASRLGLNRSSLRAARALPPEKLEIVRLAISQGSSKSEVLSVIEDLAEKVEQTEKLADDLRGEVQAAEEMIEKRDKAIKRLEREVQRFEKLEPDAKLQALQKDIADAMNDARGCVLGRLRQAVLALVNAGDDRHAHDVFLAGVLGQLQAELSTLREEFNLPDVSNAADVQLAAEVAQWAQ
jgi:hypothetical protein